MQSKEQIKKALMPKVILVSQNPLPYHDIGSWTTMYKNYFESDNVFIDTIVCEEPKSRFKDVEYCIVPNTITTKLKKKLKKKPHQNYVDALLEHLKPNETYIIQIVDNFGFAEALYTSLLDQPDLRNELYIQFFYHGYPPFLGNPRSRWFFEFIDEMVVLTQASYVAHKNYYTILPCLFSVLHNGIDNSKFYSLSAEKKLELKRKHSLEDKTVFLWCAQDRPKKGLDLILKVWKQLIKKHSSIELWVIGAKRQASIDHVRFFGKIPNDDLPEYYQTSDCYLFPTLCHEGFGMSLIEALHCGNYCIASALGGVPEVLQHGKLGTLIENPHFIEDWIVAIETYLGSKEKHIAPKIDFYTKDKWIDGMNSIIDNSKLHIS